MAGSSWFLCHINNNFAIFCPYLLVVNSLVFWSNPNSMDNCWLLEDESFFFPDIRWIPRKKLWLGNSSQFREYMDTTRSKALPPFISVPSQAPKGVGKVVVMLHLSAVGSEGFRIAQEGATAAACWMEMAIPKWQLFTNNETRSISHIYIIIYIDYISDLEDHVQNIWRSLARTWMIVNLSQKSLDLPEGTTKVFTQMGTTTSTWFRWCYHVVSSYVFINIHDIMVHICSYVVPY